MEPSKWRLRRLRSRESSPNFSGNQPSFLISPKLSRRIVKDCLPQTCPVVLFLVLAWGDCGHKMARFSFFFLRQSDPNIEFVWTVRCFEKKKQTNSRFVFLLLDIFLLGVLLPKCWVFSLDIFWLGVVLFPLLGTGITGHHGSHTGPAFVDVCRSWIYQKIPRKNTNWTNRRRRHWNVTGMVQVPSGYLT